MLLKTLSKFLATLLLLFPAVADGDVTAPTPPPTSSMCTRLKSKSSDGNDPLLKTVTPLVSRGLFGLNRLTASMNKYMDTIFTNIISNATSLNIEPLTLPNVTKPLTSKWYFPYTHLNLTEGTLLNLQSIQRYGDCIVSYGNDTIEISVDAAFTDLQVDYDFKALSSYSWFSLSGLLHGEVEETQVYADITLDANTLAIRAKKISFPGTKKIDFCIRSTILATWVVNAILEVVTLFSGLIIDDIQDAVTSAFNDFFENDFPHMIIQG